MDWNNKTEVLKRVSLMPKQLNLASKELRDDKDVVYAAIRNDGMALRYASERLRSDSKVVEEALVKNMLPFIYASEKIRGENGLARRFFIAYPNRLFFIPKFLRESGGFLAEVEKNRSLLRKLPDYNKLLLVEELPFQRGEIVSLFMKNKKEVLSRKDFIPSKVQIEKIMSGKDEDLKMILKNRGFVNKEI